MRTPSLISQPRLSLEEAKKLALVTKQEKITWSDDRFACLFSSFIEHDSLHDLFDISLEPMESGLAAIPTKNFFDPSAALKYNFSEALLLFAVKYVDTEKTIAFYEFLKNHNHPINPKTHERLIVKCGKAGSDKFLSIFDDFRNSGKRISFVLLEWMIHYCTKYGYIYDAISLYEYLKRMYSPNVYLLDKVIFSGLKYRKTPKFREKEYLDLSIDHEDFFVEKITELMIEALQQKLPISNDHFPHMILCLNYGMKLEKADQLMSLIRELNIPIIEAMLNPYIEINTFYGRFDVVEKLLMEYKGKFLLDCQPFRAMLNGYKKSQCNNFLEFKSFFVNLADNNLDTFDLAMCLSFVQLCSKFREHDTAVDFILLSMDRKANLDRKFIDTTIEKFVHEGYSDWEKLARICEKFGSARLAIKFIEYFLKQGNELPHCDDDFWSINSLTRSALQLAKDKNEINLLLQFYASPSVKKVTYFNQCWNELGEKSSIDYNLRHSLYSRLGIEDKERKETVTNDQLVKQQVEKLSLKQSLTEKDVEGLSQYIISKNAKLNEPLLKRIIHLYLKAKCEEDVFNFIAQYPDYYYDTLGYLLNHFVINQDMSSCSKCLNMFIRIKIFPQLSALEKATGLLYNNGRYNDVILYLQEFVSLGLKLNQKIISQLFSSTLQVNQPQLFLETLNDSISMEMFDEPEFVHAVVKTLLHKELYRDLISISNLVDNVKTEDVNMIKEVILPMKILSRKMEEAYQIYEKLNEYDHKLIETSISLIAVRCTSEDIWAKKFLCRLVEDLKPLNDSDNLISLKNISSLLEAYIKLGMTYEALTMIKLYEAFIQVPPSGISLALLNLLVEEGETRMASTFYGEISKRGLHPGLDILTKWIRQVKGTRARRMVKHTKLLLSISENRVKSYVPEVDLTPWSHDKNYTFVAGEPVDYQELEHVIKPIILSGDYERSVKIMRYLCENFIPSRFFVRLFMETFKRWDELGAMLDKFGEDLKTYWMEERPDENVKAEAMKFQQVRESKRIAYEQNKH